MLSINISELLLTVLNFFILMFVLDRLLYRPVIRFRAQRQSRVEESLRQETLARERQAQAREEAEQQRLASLKQAQDMAVQARIQAGEEQLAAEKEMEQAALTRAAEDTEALRAAGSESLERQRHELARTLADRLSQ